MIFLLCVIGFIVLIPAVLWVTFIGPVQCRSVFSTKKHSSGTRKGKAVAVVVVGGDFARSPRMQYHAVSLAQSGKFSQVRCVGLDFGNRLCEDVEKLVNPSNDACRIYVDSLLKPPVVPSFLQGRWVFTTIYRVLCFMLTFFWAIWRATAPLSQNTEGGSTPVVVLVQTPPAVPFLILVHMVRMLRNTLSPSRVSILIDFHNFGFTIMSIDKRPKWIVVVYRALELFFGVGESHITVSRAMQQQLCGHQKQIIPPPTLFGRDFSLPSSSVTVVPDCAPSFFRSCSRREFYDTVLNERNCPDGPATRAELKPPLWFLEECLQTESRNPKHLVITSATSWTADDDYTMVVDALKQVDATLKKANDGQANTSDAFKVWFVATGKGDGRAVFERQVQEAKFSSDLVVSTCYFQSFQAYGKMLGTSDLGVCVHASSSGLDLPMKVVDMFGCRLPVAAFYYAGLPELVNDNNGWMFKSAEDLSTVILNLLPLKNFQGGTLLRTRREYLEKTATTWSESWRLKALPVIEKLL